MSSNWKSGFLALIAGALLVPNAQAGEVSPQPVQTSMAGHCLDAAGMQEMQPIRDMAKAMSPEVILDRVFSAVEPNFQNALLSKPAEPGKPVKRPEALRDPKYFLPAIATMEMPFNWIRVRADGQVIAPASAGAANPDPNWVRAANEQKPPLALPAPQHY